MWHFISPLREQVLFIEQPSILYPTLKFGFVASDMFGNVVVLYFIGQSLWCLSFRLFPLSSSITLCLIKLDCHTHGCLPSGKANYSSLCDGDTTCCPYGIDSKYKAKTPSCWQSLILHFHGEQADDFSSKTFPQHWAQLARSTNSLLCVPASSPWPSDWDWRTYCRHSYIFISQSTCKLVEWQWQSLWVPWCRSWKPVPKLLVIPISWHQFLMEKLSNILWQSQHKCADHLPISSK